MLLIAVPARAYLALSAILASCTFVAPARAQVSSLPRGQQLILQHGLQLHGIVSTGDVFHPETYIAANYTAIDWAWDSNTNTHGDAPGFLWARWVRSPAEMPPRPGYNEEPFMSKLVALQLGDEYELNDANVRQQSIDWLNSARPQFPNTLLYVNNYGSQVNDAALSDFIQRGQPDMISFDTYPYVQGSQPVGASPVNWYADMRRYRQHALAANIPLAQYRQTFHDNYWRDPSASEFRLNTFAALAFNVKYMADFIYNTGNSTFFQGPGGDTYPKPMYNDLKQVNKEARNIGKSLVHLKPVPDAPGSPHTTNMMFSRGQHLNSNNTVVNNDIPGYMGFAIDPSSQGYTDWEFGRNDPWLSGWGVVNQGNRNNGLKGDAIISWFKLLDESLDGPGWSDQVYLMITNGLADMNDANPSETRQQITLTFGSSTVNFPYNSLERLNRQTGLVEIVPLNRISVNRAQLVLLLDGGTADLFKFPTGAPFVVPEPTGLATFALAGAAFLRRRRS